MLTTLQRLTSAEVLASDAYQPYDGENRNSTIFAFIDIDDNDTIKGLFFDDTEPNNKAVRPLSDGDANTRIYTYDIVLDKATVNDLHNTPVVITPSELGLSATEAVVVEPSADVIVSTDGTPFVAGTNRIQVINDFGDVPKQFFSTEIDNDIFKAVQSQLSQTLTVNTGLTVSATGAITGGGASSSITLRIYYRKATS